MSHIRRTEKRVEAAALLAQDELTDEEIAQRVGVARQTLTRWKVEPDFLDMITEHTARVQSAMLRLDIAKRHKRVEKLDILHEKSWSVIEARAAAMPNDAPGTKTGLLVHQVKQVGAGPSATIVDEYVVDTALMKEIRAIQEQAAAELGQKVDKVAVTGDVIVRRYVGVNPEDV
jgi:transposase-like protein